ncbi:Uncharacterized protein DAT39_013031, partial [Clarias magur]
SLKLEPSNFGHEAAYTIGWGVPSTHRRVQMPHPRSSHHHGDLDVWIFPSDRSASNGLGNCE